MKRFSYIVLVMLFFGTPLFALAQTDSTTQTTTSNGDGTVTVTQAGGSSDASSGSVSAPYSFQREGIFGCSYNGAYAMSVGSFSAQAGAYVPVADATVELNSGILVYQQCVLREVIDRMRESVTSALVKQNVAALLTGRNGSAMFVQQPSSEAVSQAMNPAVLNWLQKGGLNGVTDPQTRSLMVSAIATGYKAALSPDDLLGCPVTTNDALLKIATPGCTPLSTYWLAQTRANEVASAAANDLMIQWNWGRGFYPQQTTDANGNPLTTAPSTLVDTIANQTVTSGFDQLQNANDIGQMIGALFAGLGTQVLSSSNGLTGLAQSSTGNPSYLDQLAAESSAGLRDAAVNAAITQLSASQQVEQQYFQILSSIAQTLTQTIGQIRAQENTCWNLIIQKVCATPVTADKTCTAPVPACTQTEGSTCPTGVTLHVATSTAYSQAVIDAQIAPLATSTAAQLVSSQNALTQINQLVQGVTNTTSLDAQRIALQQLDTMIANHQLHSQPDVTTVSNQQQSVQAAMATLVQNVAQTWGNGTPNTSNPGDPNSGWCNVANPSTVQMWIQLWQH